MVPKETICKRIYIGMTNGTRPPRIKWITFIPINNDVLQSADNDGLLVIMGCGSGMPCARWWFPICFDSVSFIFLFTEDLNVNVKSLNFNTDVKVKSELSA